MSKEKDSVILRSRPIRIEDALEKTSEFTDMYLYILYLHFVVIWFWRIDFDFDFVSFSFRYVCDKNRIWKIQLFPYTDFWHHFVCGSGWNVWHFICIARFAMRHELYATTDGHYNSCWIHGYNFFVTFVGIFSRYNWSKACYEANTTHFDHMHHFLNVDQ